MGKKGHTSRSSSRAPKDTSGIKSRDKKSRDDKLCSRCKVNVHSTSTSEKQAKLGKPAAKINKRHSDGRSVRFDMNLQYQEAKKDKSDSGGESDSDDTSDEESDDSDDSSDSDSDGDNEEEHTTLKTTQHMPDNRNTVTMPSRPRVHNIVPAGHPSTKHSTTGTTQRPPLSHNKSTPSHQSGRQSTVPAGHSPKKHSKSSTTHRPSTRHAKGISMDTRLARLLVPIALSAGRHKTVPTEHSPRKHSKTKTTHRPPGTEGHKTGGSSSARPPSTNQIPAPHPPPPPPSSSGILHRRPRPEPSVSASAPPTPRSALASALSSAARTHPGQARPSDKKKDGSTSKAKHRQK